MNRIVEFWNRNRVVIISIVGFFLVMNMCGRMFMPKRQLSPVQYQESPLTDPKDVNQLRSYEEIMQDRIIQYEDNNSSFFTFVLFLTALILIGQYAYRKGWFSFLMPRWISFRAKLAYTDGSDRLIMRITIHNNTTESKTFLSPQLFFRKWGKVRKFVIKNTDFPLTLTPGTGHTLTIDVEQFYEKVKGLADYRRIGAMIETNFGELFTSRAYPRWLIFKKK